MARARKVAPFHAHGCIRCDRRYMDNCTQPEQDGHCFPCRSGQPPSVYDEGRLPQDCCREHSKRVRTADELFRYGLAGAHDWWRCRRCSRTHPFDPAQTV